MSATIARVDRLTRREREVMQLLADGHSNKTAARHLWISVETVKTHVRSSLKKLGAKTRTQAVAILWRERIIT